MPTLSQTLTRATTLTAMVNEIKAPNNFISNLVYRRRNPVTTEFIEFSLRSRGRKIAPFVRKNGSAIMVDSHDDSFRVAEPPHIRIKRPMEPSDLINQRRAGAGIHMNTAQQRRMIRMQMAQELRNLSLDADETEEWLAAQSIRGVVSYETNKGDAFEITYPRASTHDVTLVGTARWGQSAENIRKDFLTAAQLINDAVSLNATDVILGTNAADAFVDSADIQSKLDNRRVDAGFLELRNRFQEDGALFLGTFFNGIRVWRYGRTVDVNGTSEALIRADYAEFIAVQSQAEFVYYYGAIADADALGEGALTARRRFSKSWITKDPSTRVVLLASNPLPVPRRPDSMVSMKVVN